MADPPPHHAFRTRWRWIVGSLLVTGFLLLTARAVLNRVQRGELFLLAMPWDTPASSVEVIDARMTAEEYLLPASIFLGLVGLTVALAGPQRLAPSSPASRLEFRLTMIFLASAAADLVTTLWFFHDGGIDLEVHPGIRLFGYAWGRTAGPIAGKLVQAAGILLLCRVIRRGGLLPLITVTCAYTAAAVYNISQMPMF